MSTVTLTSKKRGNIIWLIVELLCMTTYGLNCITFHLPKKKEVVLWTLVLNAVQNFSMLRHDS